MSDLKNKIDSLIPVIDSFDELPSTVPMLVNFSVPIFPGMTFGLQLTDLDARIAKKAQKKYNGYVGLVFKKDKAGFDPKHPRRQELYRMGTLATILRLEHESPATVRVICNASRRIRLENIRNENGVLLSDVTYPEDIHPQSEFEEREVIILLSTIIQLVKAVAEKRENIPDEIKRVIENIDISGTDKLTECVCNMFHATPVEYQAVLETLNIRERLEKILFLIRKDMVNNDLRIDIMRRVEKRMEKSHRTYVLQEQLKEIRAELGSELDPKDADVDKFQKTLEELRPFLNPEAAQKIAEEIDKLRATNSQSPDYTISKNYLDWLTGLPWDKTTEDVLSVAKARSILDRDHYGLEDVKKRILEFIGVAKLKGTVDGSIICLIGPPGVGKTSLGRSVAESLGRKFFRFSLGGMRDEAEIKGHRRTYIGAQPGKVISAIKTCGSKNPVIMLDEIDKLGISQQGDPASALLEVLDPEQNNCFRDHFLDIPFDLSQVLFIATANVRESIPAPLWDRMEIISLSGYITEEKLNIASKHLIPKQLPRNGLKKSNISFPNATLRAIIDGYARDSGVRALEKSIGSCMRKVAMEIAEGEKDEESKTIITKGDLVKYLGKPLFYDDPLVTETRPGVAMGLAWTSAGGATLYVEALAIPGEPGMKITGQLGDVMKESTQIAYSLVEAYRKDFGIEDDFFKTHKIHIHVPAGATPKDGPSAGVTLASALISGATGRKLPPRWAMTGELTLTSRVLPVGGIKEKMIAARRAGVKDVILPKENQKDFEEIHERAREGLTAHFVSDYGEVFKLLFNSGA